MKYHLVSGGAGFVGRNMVKRLLSSTRDTIVVVDDLSTGWHPERWMEGYSSRAHKDIHFLGKDERVIFMQKDIREVLRGMMADSDYFKNTYGIPLTRFTDVFHFAAIVGGRAKIDGDPMLVGQDLSIDAEFFYWVVNHKPDRVLFPSSSAAYPIHLQTESNVVALYESAISFDEHLGMPDMTYGWSKLTGEYLARIAAEHYGISVACVRPMSGYGEDQDLSYPIPAIAARAARKDNPFEVWGTGEQGRDFVHIDDCIDLILLAMDNIHDGSGINIGSGKLTNFLQIIDIFTDFAGYKPTIKRLLDKPVGVHARHANMDYVYEKFGWKPRISVREGMRRVYEQAVKNLNA